MTTAQLRAYGQAAERARRRDLRDLLVIVRGAQYDKAGFQKLTKALEDDG